MQEDFIRVRARTSSVEGRSRGEELIERGSYGLFLYLNGMFCVRIVLSASVACSAVYAYQRAWHTLPHLSLGLAYLQHVLLSGPSALF